MVPVSSGRWSACHMANGRKENWLFPHLNSYIVYRIDKATYGAWPHCHESMTVKKVATTREQTSYYVVYAQPHQFWCVSIHSPPYETQNRISQKLEMSGIASTSTVNIPKRLTSAPAIAYGVCEQSFSSWFRIEMMIWCCLPHTTTTGTQVIERVCVCVIVQRSRVNKIRDEMMARVCVGYRCTLNTLTRSECVRVCILAVGIVDKKLFSAVIQIRYYVPNTEQRQKPAWPIYFS